MKKYARKFEHLLRERLSREGLEYNKQDGYCFYKSEDCIVSAYFSMDYIQKAMEFAADGHVNVYCSAVDELLKDAPIDTLYMFYGKNETNPVSIISAPMLWFLPLHFGKEHYPTGHDVRYEKKVIIENVEVAVDYFYREMYEKMFVPIRDRYGTIALADETINDEILKNGHVKQANIVYVDHDFHCMRSLLFAYLNNNPNLPALLEICDASMEKTRKEKPDGDRILMYDFVRDKVRTGTRS